MHTSLDVHLGSNPRLDEKPPLLRPTGGHFVAALYNQFFGVVLAFIISLVNMIKIMFKRPFGRKNVGRLLCRLFCQQYLTQYANKSYLWLILIIFLYHRYVCLLSIPFQILFYVGVRLQYIGTNKMYSAFSIWSDLTFNLPFFHICILSN